VGIITNNLARPEPQALAGTVAALAAMSFGAIRGLSLYWGWNVLLAKVLTDTVLSLASFALQRTFVFPLKDER